VNEEDPVSKKEIKKKKGNQLKTGKICIPLALTHGWPSFSMTALSFDDKVVYVLCLLGWITSARAVQITSREADLANIPSVLFSREKRKSREEGQDRLKTFIFFRSYFPTHICRPLQEWKIHMSSCTLTGRDIPFESWVRNPRKKNPWLRLLRLHLWKDIFLKFSNDAAKNCKWYVSLIIITKCIYIWWW